MKKRFLSTLLAVCMILTLLPSSVFAANDIIASGECGAQGDNLTWILDSEGTLTISGEGNMMGSPKFSDTATGYDFCKDIKTVVIEDGVTSIGYYAFINCSNLTEIIIPKTVTSIGAYALNCGSLSSLIGINVSAENQHYCSEDGILFSANKKTLICYPAAKIGAYSIPDSVTSIAGFAFHSCADLTDIVIPDGITSIGSSTFSGCIGLTEITLPGSVTRIEREAFRNCTNLSNITLPSSLTSIGQDAFVNCRSLTEISLPDSVRSIAYDAFGSCKSLTEITIPANAQFVEYNTWYSGFRDCSSLAAIHVSAGNPYYSSEDGILFSADKTKLIRCPAAKSGTYAIPDGVTSIEDYAFRDCSILTEISISDNVSSIGKGAFEDCSNLTGNITVPNSVTSIEDRVFYGCKSLTGIILPDGITSVGNQAFSYCESLAEITVPDSVTSMGSEVFEYCFKLTKATLSDNITSIGGRTFHQCYALREANIPTNLTSIPSSMFNLCRNLTGSITIPNGVTSVGSAAFCWCSNITKVTIPDSVTSMGLQAFGLCESLTEITIPSSVTEIGPALFSYCYKLTKITIPDSVTDIKRDAFEDCDKISDVFYSGTRAQWRSINIDAEGNAALEKAKIHCIDDPTIAYDSNGGAGVMDSIQLTMSDVYVFPSCGFTAPAGKEFKAWSIGGAEYVPGVTLDVTIGTTVTAIWKDIDAPITPPNVSDKYTVSYDANGGTGTMADTLVGASEIYTFPACGFTAPVENEFKAWQIGNAEYNPNDVYNITADTTVIAVWQDAATTPTQPVTPPAPISGYTLTGTITGHTGVTYTSVTAQLVGLNGSIYSAEVGEGVTDNTGKTDYSYTVTAPAGQYTLEVEARTDKGGVVNRTAVVKLTGNGQMKDINLPNGQAKIKVENKIKTAALVGGLDELIIDAEGEVTGEVTLTIENADNSSPDVTAIRNAAPDRTLEFMDISITKSENGVESAITDTGDATVEIVLAFDRTGKRDIAVYRYHDGNVDTLTTQTSGDGEKIEVDDDSIAIYAKKFSVYAIGYAVSTTDPDTPSRPITPSRPSNSSTSSSYSISIPVSITGGTVTAQPTSATAGSKVTITATPNSDYELNTLTITDASGNRMSLTNQGNNQYTFTMPSSKATVDAVFTKIWSNPFSDVSENLWYYDAVKFANGNGLMSGVGNSLFVPEANLTRAQFAQILYNKEGKPAVNVGSNFVDMASGTWYTNAVNWAAANDIVSGYGDGRFGPNDNITREQLAVMLWRYAGSPAITNKELNFTDADKASGYALNALCWAVENGIINGYGNGQLGPQGLATRAQVAQMLKNYMKR